MTNEILINRICHMIAMTYAVEKDLVCKAFQKLNSLDKTLELTQSGKLSEIFKQRTE